MSWYLLRNVFMPVSDDIIFSGISIVMYDLPKVLYSSKNKMPFDPLQSPSFPTFSERFWSTSA